MTATGFLRCIGVNETCNVVTFSIALEVSLARDRSIVCAKRIRSVRG